jgi:aminoglycoside phosphotransferase (APT) family kinase protein
MTASREDERFAQLIRRIDPQSTLLRRWVMRGGVSAQVTALEILLPNGQTKKMIVRRHGAVDRARNPRIAADEFRLLQILRSVALPVPTPYTLDQSGEIFPTPYIVVECIEGQTVFAPADVADYLRQFAVNLAGIHRLDCAKMDLSFLPDQEKRYTEKIAERPAHLDASLAEGRIRDALEAAWPLVQHGTPTLLHGDYWPGNLLWKDGRLVAILDWEDAARGDPLADVANSRLEILWAFGSKAMDVFTHQYQSMMPAIDCTNLPYWDLCAALRPVSQISTWGLDQRTEKTMRERHRLFITQAFEKLSTQ